MSPSVPKNDHKIGQINSKCSMSSSVTWTINNFSELCKKNIDCCSPIFISKDLYGVESQWKLRFFEQSYPSTYTKMQIKSLSLYLTLTNDTKPTKVNYTIGIIDSNNTLVNKQNNGGEDVSFSSETPTWGTAKFIDKEVLISRLMNLTTANAIKIYCEIKVRHQPDTSNGAKRFKSAHNPILKSLTKLLNDKKYSAVQFIVDNEKLFAHKNILAASSTYFAAFFEQKLDTELIVIEEKEFDSTVMREILNFIYSGNINFFDQWNIRLLVAAHKYAIKELKELCQNSIRETLEMSIKTNKTNIYQSVKDLLDIAHSFDINELKNLCEDTLEEYLLLNNVSPSVGLIEKCKNILVEAHKYKLERLKLLCEKNLCSNLNVASAIDYLSLAYLYECSELKKLSIAIIVQNGQTIVNQPKFETIAHLDKNLVVEVIRALLTFPKVALGISTK